jgi:hypothetical protein
MEVSGQILAPATLPPRTDPRCPVNTTLAESRSRRSEEETYFMALPGIEKDSSVIQPVA